MIATCESITITPQGEELEAHGTPLFPLVCYEEDVTAVPVPWRWHDDWEVIQSIQDTVRVVTTSGTIDLQPGQAIFLGGRCVHEVMGLGERAMLRSTVFHPRFLAGMDSIIWQKYVHPLQNAGAVPLNSASSWQRICIEAFCDCWQAVADEVVGYELLARDALSRMALTLFQQMGAQQRPVTAGEERSQQRIRSMLQFIQEHYSEELSISQIADSALVSKSECLRCFRTTIHTTPGQYLKDYRLQKAAALLTSTGLKAGEIGAACGFTDAAYFTKTFRETKGCTPSEYRRAHRPL